MLKVASKSDDGTGQGTWVAEEQQTESTIDLEWLMAVARRQMLVIAICAFLGGIVAVVYSFTATPLYTAATHLLIDPRRSSTSDELMGLSDVGIETGAVESQVQVLQSEEIVAKVAENLDLANDPQFGTATVSLSPIKLIRDAVKSILVAFGFVEVQPVSEVEAAFARERGIIEALKGGLAVNRLGLSYVLNVAFTSAYPELAARIANGFADAYLNDQLEAQFEFTRRASNWLSDRVIQLKEQALQSDLAIQQFRAENNLIMADGRLVSDQQLGELNTQLIFARAERAEVEARYERIQSIIESGDMEAAVAESLSSNVITGLRQQFLEASKRQAEISERLGENHQTAIKARNDMKEFERLIFQELGRIAESYESDYQVATIREEALEDSLAKMVGSAANINTTMVQLRELEREAQTYRNLYETFLQRYQEAIQRESFPIVEARVISQAAKPIEASYPNKKLFLLFGLAAGGTFGIGIGAMREFRDRSFRSGNQVNDDLDQQYIGGLPNVKGSAGRGSGAAGAGDVDESGRRAKRVPLMRYVLDAPLSIFAETLRSAKVSADLNLGDKNPKIIGIVSTLPNEGKSTVAKNFATLLSYLGNKTLLIDGDLRNPGLSKEIAPHAKAGLIEALHEGQLNKDLIVYEEESRLAILPTVLRRRTSQTNMLLSSPAMKAILTQAGNHFDYIVIDLPPLGPVVEVRAAAAQIDAFLYVVEWGRTSRKLVRTTLFNNESVRSKCLGVILNKINSTKIRLYEEHDSPTYYSSEYGKYIQRDVG